MFEGQSDCDVVVVLKVEGLHRVERYVCEHHKILTQAIHTIHCVYVWKRCHGMLLLIM